MICYDVCDPIRLRKLYKIMKGFGISWQYSVFFCNLKDKDYVVMYEKIKATVNNAKDRVILVDLGADQKNLMKNIVVIGTPLGFEPEQILVV